MLCYIIWNNRIVTKTSLTVIMPHFLLSPHTMPEKSIKKKYKVIEANLDVEIVSRIEIVYEDTKAITGAEHDFKWGEIYQMIRDRNVPDAGLEDMPLYENIRKSGITKAATCPELFPCVEVIRWILPRENLAMMIISNIEGEDFASFTTDYLTSACKL